MATSALDSTDNDKGGKKPTKKLSRSLMGKVFFFVLATTVAYLFFRLGGDLGQNKVDVKRDQAKKQTEQQMYQAKFQNPKREAEEEYSKAQQKIAQQKQKQVDDNAGQLLAAAQQVGAASGAANQYAPPPPYAGGGIPNQVNAMNVAKFDAAHAAAQRGRHAEPAGEESPSFIVYTSQPTGKNGALVTSPLVDLRAKGTNTPANSASEAESAAGDQDYHNDPRYIAAKKQLAQYEANQAKAQSALGSAPPVAPGVNTASGQWLYQVQNSAVKASKPIMAERTTGLYWMAPGTVINAVLLNAVDTKLPGRLTARVTQNIYDSRYGRYLLIPAGSMLEGQYDSNVQDGQNRVLMAFDTLVTPSGGIVPLGNMSASDALGRAGMEGDLHTHFWKRMGISLLMAFEAVGLDKLSPTQTTVSNGGATTSPMTDGASIIANTANQELKRQFAISPNITIPAGQPMSIITTGAIEVPPIANTK